MSYLRVLLFLFLFLNFQSFASSAFPDQISFLTGNIGVTYAESESTLVSTDGTPASDSSTYSSSATAMPLVVEYERFSTAKRSYFISGAGPLVASTPDRIFSVNSGAHFYLNKAGTIVNLSTDKLTYFSAPGFRYYIGPQIGLTYLIYNTLSQTKNDIILNLGGHAGGIYTYNPKWGIKGELAFSKGIGALVSTTTIQILIGATYTL